MPGKLQLVRTTIGRLRKVIWELVKSEQGPKAVRLAVLILVILAAISALNVLNNYVNRDFMTAIEKRDLPEFFTKASIYCLIFFLLSCLASLSRFTEERLGILWREQLTWRFTEAYLNERTYYRLDSTADVPNPDQRITDDVKAFTTTTLSFLLLILNGTITAISFTGVLWTISPVLLGVAILYAVIGSVCTILLGKPLIRLNYHQLDHEANFRSDLIHVRENAESIALAHREGRFKTRLHGKLKALTGNFRHLIRVNRNLAFFTNNYNYFIQILPAIIIAPAFIRGEIEFGVIPQSTIAFATLLGAFSLIVTQFQSISAFTAVTARLQTLTEGIEKTKRHDPCGISIEESADRVEFRHVSLFSPDRTRTLVSNLSFAIQPGSRWLITSPEDAPKVALFRATAGVWNAAEGKILRPDLEEILFLPERPYLPPGTLRNTLLRSGAEKHVTDKEILNILGEVGLGEVVIRAGGLSAVKDWDDEFAIGEQHLFSVARLILAHPRFVFLDRPGSSLPKAQIALILDLFKKHHIACVLLSKNGEANLPYDRHLELHPGGNWTITRHDEISRHRTHGEIAG